MKHRLFLLPPLAAVFWGSCTDSAQLSQREMDVRFAVCAFAMSCALLIVGSLQPWNLIK